LQVALLIEWVVRHCRILDGEVGLIVVVALLATKSGNSDRGSAPDCDSDRGARTNGGIANGRVVSEKAADAIV